MTKANKSSLTFLAMLMLIAIVLLFTGEMMANKQVIMAGCLTFLIVLGVLLIFAILYAVTRIFNGAMLVYEVFQDMDAEERKRGKQLVLKCLAAVSFWVAWMSLWSPEASNIIPNAHIFCVLVSIYLLLLAK